MQIFTDEWAAAFREAINEHPHFRQFAANWELGPIIAIARAEFDFEEDLGLFLGIENGECNFALILSARDAYRAGNYVYEASYETWGHIFDTSEKLIHAFLTGKIKLTKGNMVDLLNTGKVADCLVQAAASLY